MDLSIRIWRAHSDSEELATAPFQVIKRMLTTATEKEVNPPANQERKYR
jgi:hypothetical protein